jgi:uncharacterized membrane protein
VRIKFVLGAAIGLLIVGCSTKERETGAAQGGEAGEASSSIGGQGPDSSSGEAKGGDPGSTPDDTPACSIDQFFDGKACEALTSCGAGESESVAATATSDRVCSTCGAGKYESNGECAELATCDPGSRQTKPPTAISDRECAACEAGTFTRSANQATCAPWTECLATQEETTPGTSTSDAVCTNGPDCDTADDRSCTTECPCSSAEGVCTANDQCASGTSCVAGSGKKVGRAGDTCLATHCNNDVKDSDETSVDCGGVCGCRATFEVISLKNIPAGLSGFDFRVTSRDGKRQGGWAGRGQSSYPIAVASDGTVSELETYGTGGAILAANTDGSVLVGVMGCANPPTCSDTTSSIVQWSGPAAPKVINSIGTPRAISSSGSIVAGDFYDSGASEQRGFLINGSSRFVIPELLGVVSVTPDGKYVAGSLRTASEAGLWSVQTASVTKIGLATWSQTTITATNGVEPVVVGNGYVSGSDSSTGFRWKAKVFTELGLLSGFKYTTPSAVSLDGNTIVGVAQSANFTQESFIWTEQDKLRKFVDELQSRGLEFALDFVITGARFVSDDGKTIVGHEFTEPPTFWRATLD